MKRKIFGLMSCIMMMFFVLGVLPVQAAESTTSVEPRAALCGSCGIGTMVLDEYGTWSGWTTVSRTSCVHYPYGEDLQQSRKRNVYYKCSYCREESSSTETQRQTVCKGFK